jgi:hypothetical protein
MHMDMHACSIINRLDLFISTLDYHKLFAAICRKMHDSHESHQITEFQGKVGDIQFDRKKNRRPSVLFCTPL